MESILSGKAIEGWRDQKKRDGKFRLEGVLELLELGERSSDFETITRLPFNNLQMIEKLGAEACGQITLCSAHRASFRFWRTPIMR